jgi:hypothetical protein
MKLPESADHDPNRPGRIERRNGYVQAASLIQTASLRK